MTASNSSNIPPFLCQNYDFIYVDPDFDIQILIQILRVGHQIKRKNWVFKYKHYKIRKTV